jgi:integrase
MTRETVTRQFFIDFLENIGDDSELHEHVCDFLTEESKNLTEVTRQEEAQLEGTTHATADTKGKFVEFAFHMEKKGLAPDTIRGNLGALRALIKRNANLFDPESVKTALAKEKIWSQNRRRNVINAYTVFLKLNGMTWEKPKCQVTRKFPFIPTEQELNNLIAGCGKKTATFLQLLKETAMRSGEAKRRVDKHRLRKEPSYVE